MEQKEKETLKETTTKRAFLLILWYSWVITKNIARAINKAVYRLPWVFMAAVVIVSSVVSFVYISKARVERDQYNQTTIELQQQLDKYKSVYGDYANK